MEKVAAIAHRVNFDLRAQDFRSTASLESVMSAVAGEVVSFIGKRRLMRVSRSLNRAVKSAPQALGGIYAMGGFAGGQPLATVERYDPGEDAWLALPDMPTARYGFGAVVVANDAKRHLFNKADVHATVMSKLNQVYDFVMITVFEDNCIQLDAVKTGIQRSIDPFVRLAFADSNKARSVCTRNTLTCNVDLPRDD